TGWRHTSATAFVPTTVAGRVSEKLLRILPSPQNRRREPPRTKDRNDASPGAMCWRHPLKSRPPPSGCDRYYTRRGQPPSLPTHRLRRQICSHCKTCHKDEERWYPAE